MFAEWREYYAPALEDLWQIARPLHAYLQRAPFESWVYDFSSKESTCPIPIKEEPALPPLVYYERSEEPVDEAWYERVENVYANLRVYGEQAVLPLLDRGGEAAATLEALCEPQE